MAGRPKKVVKGALSHEQKGRIIFLLKTLGGESEETYDKIAEDIGRPKDLIKKTVIEMKEALGVDTTSEVKFNVKDSLIKRVLLSLINAGLTKQQARSKITRVLSKLSEEERSKIDEATLHSLCLRNISAGDLFVTSTAGGQKGVAINNQAASEVSDGARDKFNFEKSKNPNIYKIFDDE